MRICDINYSAFVRAESSERQRASFDGRSALVRIPSLCANGHLPRATTRQGWQGRGKNQSREAASDRLTANPIYPPITAPTIAPGTSNTLPIVLPPAADAKIVKSLVVVPEALCCTGKSWRTRTGCFPSRSMSTSSPSPPQKQKKLVLADRPV